MATNSSDAPKVNANQPAGAASAEREALDKVRSILFGEQAQAYDQRIDQIEKSLVTRLQKSQAALAERLSALEKRLDDHSEAARSNQEDTVHAIAELRTASDKQFEVMDENMKMELSALRMHIEDALDTVAHQGAKRSDLAQMLQQLADQLTKD